ncbi:MAG: response regulator, partial [Pseudomonadota bacterium]
LIITVSDNGVGIEPESLDHIFDYFFSTKNMDEEGRGLGLSTCYSIIQEMKGHINVESRPTEGTSFTITLPLSHHPLSNATRFKGKILVVDDEEYIRIIMQEMLEDMGLTVHTAINGKDALNKIFKDHYDLIFTDIKMPEMDGLELIKRLRSDPNFTSKIVVITGNFQEELFRNNPDNVQSQIDGFINKPFNPDHITDVLDYHLYPRI